MERFNMLNMKQTQGVTVGTPWGMINIYQTQGVTVGSTWGVIS